MPTTNNPPEQTGGERNRVSKINDNSFEQTPSSDIRSWVRKYLEAKFDVVVLGPRSKRPRFKQWETGNTIESDFEPDDNVGIRLGKDGLA